MIDFAPLIAAVQEGVAIGLGHGAEIVARSARAKAPVRQIFSNRGPVKRTKTAAEMDEDRSIRAALGLSVEGSRDNPLPSIITGDRIPPRRWKDRRLSRADQLLNDRQAVMARMLSGKNPRTPERLRQFHASQVPWRTALSKRGAYEVKTRRAVGRFGGHLTIGGALRESIVTVPVIRTGGRSIAWVIALAEYAKYQEFGTAHNAAHPFLRPAAMESQQKAVEAISRGINAAIARSNLGRFEIEIVVAI